MTLQTNIHKALEYGQSIVGTKYGAWDGEVNTRGDKGPFWAYDADPPAPSTVRRKKCNCAGLINLMRRKLKLPVPMDETDVYGGTVGDWYYYLKRAKKLKLFNPLESYPPGTLLLSKDVNLDVQGHLAVVIKSDPHDAYKSKIIHSFSNDAGVGDTEPGVCITEVGYIYFRLRYLEGKINSSFQYVCLPENWLCPNGCFLT
jgi:hypothetical protein